MKYKFLSVLFGLALAVPASGQPATFYVNDGIVNCPPDIPPQVDALNFVNNNFFSINFTTLTFVNELYDTANTLNFTNVGMMIGNNGFQFDTAPSGTGLRRMANSFYNSGTISVGSVNNTNGFFNFFFGFGLGLPKLLVSATNIVDSGTNIVGVDGWLKLVGKNVDLSRGTFTMEGLDDSTSPLNNFFFFNNNLGILTAYAAVGTNVMVPASYFEATPPSSPGIYGLTLPAAVVYIEDFAIGTNRFLSAVFLSDTNAFVSNNVYFNGDIVVEWSARQTNLTTGTFFTNYLYLFDDFLFSGSNYLAGGVPANFSFVRGPYPFFLGTPAAPGSPAGRFNNTLVTNEYAAYGAVIAPTTQLPEFLPGGNLTNLPGRIEIVADDQLNLARAQIRGLNYLRLQATNHFAGSSGARISAPFSDISLGTTNGSLTISNLLVPSIPRFTGEVDLWSGRWTNNDAVYQTAYHVLFVDSRLSPNTPPYVHDLYLRSTNVIISDIMNVQHTFLIDAENLTVTTNDPGSLAASGEVNLLDPAIVWTLGTPRLKNLTNNGAIRMQNAGFFGGSRTTPFFSTNFNEPYLSMVNHGEIANQGMLIWANYFENTGLLFAGIGPGSITLQSVNALLKDGSFLAPGGDISLTSGSLVVSNHSLQAGRGLSFTVTNLLDDGSLANAVGTISNNTWTVGGTSGSGINLLTRPTQASLLGTTVSATAPPLRNVRSRWAADDRDCSPTGFGNNAAVGRLILDGGDDSLFTFSPVSLRLTFDDAATQPVPPSGIPVRSGIYQPSNYVPARQMLTNGVPADIRAVLSLPYANNLAGFRGTNSLNGNWRLFMDDRTTNHLGNYISWDWSLAVSVLASNYTYTTNFATINGTLVSTGSTETTNYSGANPAFAGAGLALPAGAPPVGAVAQPYPSTNSVSLLLRNHQAVTNAFAVTNQIGPNVFVTNRVERVYTTDHVTNVVVSLSAPTVSFPADLDVLLVGPHGEKVMLMAGAGALDTANRNALYVDYLEFRNFTTNRDANGNFPALVLDPGLKIYFAEAVMNGVSIAEKLDGKNGGQFCWVSAYAGFYSSTDVVYPDGTTNTFNAALVASCNLDSDGDGVVNCADPTPILRPQDLALAVSVVKQPAPKAQVSWQSGPYAANYVYYKNALGATNWQLLTNFVSSPAGGRVSVTDPINPTNPRYYRVRVNSNQP